MLQQHFNVAIRGHETMRPERNATFVLPFFYLISWRLKNAGSRNDHLKFTVHSAEPSQYSISYFADQLYRKSARFAFRGNTVLRKTRRAQFAGQRRRAGAIPDNFDFFRLLINVLQITVIHSLLAQFREQKNGEGGVEIAQRRSTNSI